MLPWHPSEAAWPASVSSSAKAMGGKLEICAYFPDGDVKINQFEDLDQNPPA